MRRVVFSAAVFSTAIVALCFPVWAQAQAPKAPTAGDNVNADDIIRKFAAKEKEFEEARDNYTYRQSLKFEELDPGGNPTGHQWSRFPTSFSRRKAGAWKRWYTRRCKL